MQVEFTPTLNNTKFHFPLNQYNTNDIKYNNRNIVMYSKKSLNNEITNLIDNELGRKFFDRVKDGRKYYYSRYIRGKELDKYVINVKLKNKAKRNYEAYRNKDIQNKVKELLKQKILSRDMISEIFKSLKPDCNKVSINSKDYIKNIRKIKSRFANYKRELQKKESITQKNSLGV
jgi:hypothetical protein